MRLGLILLGAAVVAPVRAELVAHWRLDEGFGATKIVDAVAGLEATPAGGGASVFGEDGAGRNTGTSTQFDSDAGVGYWVSENANVFTSTTFSVSFWVRGALDTATAYRTVVSTRLGDKNGLIFYINQAQSLQFWVHTLNTNWNSQAINADLQDSNTWYHVVGTYDDATRIKRFAVTEADAVWARFRQMTCASNMAVHATDHKLAIGANLSGGYRLGVGGQSWVDDVRYYNHVLTETEAEELHRAGSQYRLSPRLHWRLDEPAGSGVASDSAGGLDGTVTGGTFGVGGISGSAIDLNSADSVRRATTNDLEQPSYTLSLWCKPNSTTAGCITDYGPDRCGWRWYYSYEEARKLNLWNWSGAAWERHTFTDLPENQWYHFVTTFDGVSRNYVSYIDGVQRQSTTQAGAYAIPTSGYFSVGRRSVESFNGFDGVVDDVQYYGEVLNSSMVEWLYDNPGRALSEWPIPAGLVTIIR